MGTSHSSDCHRQEAAWRQESRASVFSSPSPQHGTHRRPWESSFSWSQKRLRALCGPSGCGRASDSSGLAQQQSAPPAGAPVTVPREWCVCAEPRESGTYGEGGEGGINQKAGKWKWLPCGTSHCTIPGARGHFIQCERRIWCAHLGPADCGQGWAAPAQGRSTGPSLGPRSPCPRETCKLKIPKETKEEWEVVNQTSGNTN